MQPDDQSYNYKRVFESLWRIEKEVLETVDFEEAAKRIVNIVFTELGYINFGYEVVVLTLLDEKEKVLKRIAISETETAARFLKETPIPFEDIIIPLYATQNLLIKAITNKKRYITDNIAELFVPAVDPEWVRSFDDVVGNKASIVYPIIAKDRVLGVMIFTLSKSEREIKEEEWSILESFVGAVGIALDNALLFESLNKANKRLEELDHLKDEFVSTASHEIKTPMTFLQSYILKVLNEEKDRLSQTAKDRLNKAYSETQRLIYLVDGMLDISKIEAGNMEFNLSDFDMAKLAKDVKEELSDAILQKKLTVEIADWIFNIHSDRNKIYSVLLNLIDNAIKFTLDGGRVSINFKVNGNFLETAVADTGIGIKQEDLGKLFVKFEKLGNTNSPIFSTSGAGLGLYLTKKIVEQLGGKIEVQSEFGKGSTFTFSIPLSS